MLIISIYTKLFTGSWRWYFYLFDAAVICNALRCRTHFLPEHFTYKATNLNAATLCLLRQHGHQVCVNLNFKPPMFKFRLHRNGFEAVQIIGCVVRVPELRRFFVAGKLFWNRVNYFLLVWHNIFLRNQSSHAPKSASRLFPYE